jgi:hypothetical protein
MHDPAMRRRRVIRVAMWVYMVMEGVTKVVGPYPAVQGNCRVGIG